MSKQKTRHSAVTRKLLLQCAVSMAVWAGALILFAAAAYYICSSFKWDGSEPLYIFLDFIRDHMDLFLPAAVAAGWLIIFCVMLRRSLSYLDDITVEAEKLADLESGQLILPEELKDIQDELNSVHDNAIKSAAAAKEAEQRKNDLIVYLAHDLKTPLTSVIGYLTLMRDEPDISPGTRARYTGIALEKAERLEELINEFFDVARFNMTNSPTDLSTIDLGIMLEQLVSEFEPVLKQNELSCRLKINENIMLKCDADKLSRVFDNLLRNAVNYSFKGSEIEISANADGQSAVIVFKDHGSTIPPDKLSRIFEQFYRLDSSRGTANGGAGLGLAIAKQIVTLHGGEITAYSENETTSFTVKIPNAVSDPQ